MSDTFSFAPDDIEKSPEEKLAELERLWPIMQEKIAKYDALIRDNKSMSSDVSDIRAQTNECKAALQALTERHVAASSSLNESINKVEGKISDISPEVRKIFAYIDEVKQDTNQQVFSMCKNVENFKNIVQDTLSKAATGSQIDFLKDYMTARYEEVRKEIAYIASLAGKNKLETTDQNDKISDYATSLDSFKASLSSLSEEVKSFKRMFSSIDLSTTLLIGESSQKIRSEFDGKLNALNSALSASPEQIQNVKADIMSRMEHVALDSSNAALRANSSAAKITLIEKKIENLFLLVDKLTPK